MADKKERCILKLKAEGKTKEEAFAICTDALKMTDDAGIKLSDTEDIPFEFIKLADHRRKKKKKKRGFNVRRVSSSSYTELTELKGVEILRVVNIPERGIDITKAKLEEIKRNFVSLIDRNLHNPPAKLGHDEKQQFAVDSGLPALGWVEKLTIVGDRLLATFGEVPDMVKEAFDKGLYKKVSSEIYHAFDDPETGENMGAVLRAVAFLGADVPQVKGLKAFLQDQAGVYALDDTDKAENFTDITISLKIADPSDPEPIDIPEPPTKEELGLKPLDPDKMNPFDLEFFRQAEEAVEMLKDSQITEIDDEQSVEGLIRWVGKLGFSGCKTNDVIRSFPDSDTLCSWLWERAFERGLVAEARPHILEEEEGDNMDPKDQKIAKLSEELEASKVSAASSDEEKTKLKTELAEMTAKEKAKDELAKKLKRKSALAEVEAFANKDENKKIMTPALKTELSALAEAIGTDEVVINLDEEGKKTEKIPGHKLLSRFVENLIKAKTVKLEETAKAKKDALNSGAEVKRQEGADFADLDEKAQELVKTDPRLAKLAESQPNTAYMEAVKMATAAEPELAVRGE